MTELVETEEEYVKKLGHVCEVSNHHAIAIRIYRLHYY